MRTLMEVYRQAEYEYLSKLYDEYKVDGYSMMAKVAGVSRSQIINMLYQHGIIKTMHKHRGAYKPVLRSAALRSNAE